VPAFPYPQEMVNWMHYKRTFEKRQMAGSLVQQPAQQKMKKKRSEKYNIQDKYQDFILVVKNALCINKLLSDRNFTILSYLFVLD
jgi:hypothetical protein